MNAPYDVSQILADTKVLLLDFDGPVCAVFGGIKDHVIADHLRSMVDPLPDEAATTRDPLQVLRVVAHLGDQRLTEQVEDALCHWEVEAVKSATPTPYAAETLAAAHAAGRTVVIVSNNSPEAIDAYLQAHQLKRYVRHIIGRTHARPELMKPDPDPIFRAMTAIEATANECVLLGDSLTDVQAAQAAKVRCIGYANSPGKRQRLVDAGADALIEGPDGMAVIASAYGHERSHDGR